MASSYTALLGLVLPATGDLNGTWGSTVNSQLTQLVEDSLAGYTTADVTAGDWTLSTTGSGATNQARMMVLVPTGGSVGVPRSIFAPKQSKVYFLLNKTVTIVTLKGGPTTPTTGVSINPGQYAFVVWDPIAGDFIIAGIGNNGSWSISTTGTANIAGGTAGAIPYQVAGNQTGVLAAGTSGQVFLSGGAGAPSWANPGSLSVGTATNLAGGAGGQIPYQSSAGATAMLANGSAGQVLTSGGGTAAPSWTNVATPYGAGAPTIFTASGTWTKPASGTVALIECWGGGGGGGQGAGGGGGGAYTYKWILLSGLTATVTVTVGAGGGPGLGGTGAAGGNTTFGAYLTAYGGGPGGATGTGGGGGGGWTSAGSVSTPGTGYVPGIATGGAYPGGASFYGGGSGGTGAGGDSLYGGGAGGYSGAAAGQSLYGGAGAVTGNGNAPGGGGSAGGGGAGSGARGECHVTVY